MVALGALQPFVVTPANGPHAPASFGARTAFTVPPHPAVAVPGAGSSAIERLPQKFFSSILDYMPRDPPKLEGGFLLLSPGRSPEISSLLATSRTLRRRVYDHKWSKLDYASLGSQAAASSANPRTLTSFNTLMDAVVGSRSSFRIKSLVVKDLESCVTRSMSRGEMYGCEEEGLALVVLANRLAVAGTSLRDAQLERVHLYRDVGDEIMQKLALNAGLKALRLADCVWWPQYDDPPIMWPFAPMPGITSLQLLESEEPLMSLLETSPALDSLAFKTSQDVPLEAVEAIIAALPRLERLGLETPSDPAFTTQVLKSCEESGRTAAVDGNSPMALKELVVDMTGVPFSTVVRALVGAAPNLDSLVLLAEDGSNAVRWPGPRPPYLEQLSKLQQLTFLAWDRESIKTGGRDPDLGTLKALGEACKVTAPDGSAHLDLAAAFCVHGVDGETKDWIGTGATYTQVGGGGRVGVVQHRKAKMSIRSIFCDRWHAMVATA